MARFGLRNDFTLLAAITISSALPFTLAPLKAAALGPADRGNFAYFQAGILVITNLSILGSRLSAYKNHLTGTGRLNVRRSPLFLLTLPLAALLAFLIVILNPGLPRIVQMGIVAAAIVAPFFTLLQIELANAQMENHATRILLVTVVPILLDFAGSALLLARGEFTLRSVVVLAVGVEFARVAFAIGGYAKDARRASRVGGPNRPTVRNRPFWRDSLKFAIPATAPVLSSNVDILIFAALVRPAQLGIYSVAKIGFSLILVASQSLEGKMIAGLNAGIRHRDFLHPLWAFTLLSISLSAGATSAVLIFFPHSFAAAASLISILVIAGWLFSLARWTLAHFAAQGRADIAAASSVAIILVSVIGPAGMALAPAFGPLEMSIAFAGVQAVCLLLVVLMGSLPIFRRNENLSVKPSPVPDI